VAAAWVVAQVLGGHSASVWWATSPLSTGAGQLLSLYAPLVRGLTTVLHDSGGRAPTAEELSSTVRRHGVDVVLTTADALRSWRDGEADRGAAHPAARPLRVLAVVDGPLDDGVRRWAEERLAERVLAAPGGRPVPEDPFLATYGVSALAGSPSGPVG
jgi:acyl-coenzyme A synthetase/AMP-(fatty) acid ligase